MSVSQSIHVSSVSSLNHLVPAVSPHIIFVLKDRLDPFAFLHHYSLQQLQSGVRNCHRKTEMTRPATPPCGHIDEHVYYRAWHSQEPKARTEKNTAGSPARRGSILPPAHMSGPCCATKVPSYRDTKPAHERARQRERGQAEHSIQKNVI